jgi:hypothetical protein
MGLYKRGNTYWFVIMFEGRRIRQSLNTDTGKWPKNYMPRCLRSSVEVLDVCHNFATIAYSGV